MRIRHRGANLVELTRYAMFFPTNCYMVIEQDGLTLVDSTQSSPAAEVAAVVSEIGLELRRLAITHAHWDHAGGVAGVRQRFPNVEVLIGEREARLLAGDMQVDPGEPQSPPKGHFAKVSWTPDRLLKAGDRVGSLEVLAATGHTPGHLAFLDLRDQTLIVGDAFQTLGGVAVAGVLRPLFPFPAFATWHRPTAAVTARALQALRPARLAVGHGEILELPSPFLDGAIEEAEREAAQPAPHGER